MILLCSTTQNQNLSLVPPIKIIKSRLDGSTKPESRIQIMEQFNRDPRIFCMILSTRSGGVGVNLTGADVVIFYDSDWNPTIDAQVMGFKTSIFEFPH